MDVITYPSGDKSPSRKPFAKWRTFGWQFQVYFLGWRVLYFGLDSIDVYFQGVWLIINQQCFQEMLGEQVMSHCYLNQSWPNLTDWGRDKMADIFKRIFFNENVWSSIKISLKFVPKGPINNIPASFQIMAWRRPGDKPLSEAMLVSLLTHKCVTRPQWVKDMYASRSTNQLQSSNLHFGILIYSIWFCGFAYWTCWLFLPDIHKKTVDMICCLARSHYLNQCC